VLILDLKLIFLCKYAIRHMKIYAVITGDIIRSSSLPAEARSQLLRQLEQLFEDVDLYLSEQQQLAFEIYRGDSFQLLLEQPEQALLVAILLRAGLRSRQYGSKGEPLYADARLSIGLGEISYRAEQLGKSDGEAFRRSGRGLDNMRKRQGISISTPWETLDEEMEVACILSEPIISRWTHPQAEVIYPYLLQKRTQQELAEDFGITQGAISQRLTEAGNIDAIKVFLHRYEKLIRAKI
jgi:transcriptional regulator with XRE-family HTH domain